MSVQLKIKEIEQKTRDALIAQEKRAKAVGDKFWEAQQLERYPNISTNLIVSPITEDLTLPVTNQESTTDYLTSIRNKLMMMTSNSSEMTEKVLQNINSKQALMYLENHWDELKRFLKPMAKQLFSVDKLYLQIIKFLKLNQVIQTNKDATDGSYILPPPSYSPPPIPSVPVEDDKFTEENVFSSKYKDDSYLDTKTNMSPDPIDQQSENIELEERNDNRKTNLQKLTIPRRIEELQQRIDRINPENPEERSEELKNLNDRFKREHNKFRGGILNATTLSLYKKYSHEHLDAIFDFLATVGRGLVAPPVKQTMQKSKKKFYGKGLTQTNIHPKLFVDLEHLKNNKLTIKYKSTGKISWSVQIASPEMKQVITDLILGRYDEKRYKKLSKEDKEYIDVFIAKSKLRFEPIENEEKSLKNKFDVLVGELSAGNDNPTIRAMMIAVVERLFTLKKITKNKYLQMKDELVGV
jgi:hypothetical protein